MSTLRVRDATIEDCEDIFRLLTELAVLEKFADKFSSDVEIFKRNGFGKEKQFHCLLAEERLSENVGEETTSVGLLLYTWFYSTWIGGRVMYIEDLIVTEGSRGRGVGTALVDKAIKIADEEQFRRIQIITRRGNTGALEFHKKFGFINITDTRDRNVLRMDDSTIKDKAEQLKER